MNDRFLDRGIDIETHWLLGENSINFWLHVIYASALLGLYLFRRQNIKYSVPYRLAVIMFAFGWLLPVLMQWSMISLTTTFVDRRRAAPNDLILMVPWAYVAATCFKGLSVLLFVLSLNFDPIYSSSGDGDRERNPLSMDR